MQLITTTKCRISIVTAVEAKRMPPLSPARLIIHVIQGTGAAQKLGGNERCPKLPCGIARPGRSNLIISQGEQEVFETITRK